MDPLDFDPATTTMARLVRGVTDEQLSDPTPCPDYTVADLVDHIGGLAYAFTASAVKGEVPEEGGSGDGSRLEDGWRDRIITQLGELAKAWRDPASYDGITMAGPIEMPADVAALVALDEVVVHGWDLARATGQRYEPDAADVAAILPFLEAFASAEGVPGLFGPAVAVPADAPAFDRALGLSGRDPGWRPSRG